MRYWNMLNKQSKCAGEKQLTGGGVWWICRVHSSQCSFIMYAVISLMIIWTPLAWNKNMWIWHLFYCIPPQKNNEKASRISVQIYTAIGCVCVCACPCRMKLTQLPWKATWLKRLLCLITKFCSHDQRPSMIAMQATYVRCWNLRGQQWQKPVNTHQHNSNPELAALST